jgi:flotillin
VDQLQTLGTGVLGVIVVVVVLAIIAFTISRRYKIASPSEAFIVTGRKGKAVTNPETGEVTTDLSGQKVVMGGGVFVKPLVQQVHKLSLSSRRISVKIQGAVSQQGIRLNLDAVALVKVGGTENDVRAAAQRFLHQQDEIESFTQEVLAGSLRAIVGTLTVDEIIRDRAAFANAVAEEAVHSLSNQGLVLDTFQVQDVHDDTNYLRDKGRPEAAAAARVAAIAEAEANREAAQARAKAQEQTSEAEKNLSIRQAEFKAETDRAAATAAAAGALTKAERDQEVLAQQEKVAVRQAELTERRLDTDVRRPADAERYKAEQEAQARRNSAIFAAEAEKAEAIAKAEGSARQVELSAVADAERTERLAQAELARRKAEAEAVRAEGLAEADAISARGAAKAEALTKEAAALKEFGEAALTQRAIEILPEVARELASPMAAIKDLTVISNDGAGSLSRSVGANLKETLEVVKRSTGVDVTKFIRGLDKTSETAEVTKD